MVTSWTGLVFAVLVAVALGWWVTVQMRARLKLQPKANWPIVEATIQPGGLGTIIMGRQGNAYAACFLGYGFEAVGMRRAGLFALYGDDGTVEMVNKSLPGCAIKILYNPDDPDSSALLYSEDARFQGLGMTQDPGLLAQAPSFDLKDVMGG